MASEFDDALPTGDAGAATVAMPHSAPAPSAFDSALPPAPAEKKSSIMGTSWTTLGSEPWDVPGGGALSSVTPQPGTGGFGRYVDTSLTPSPDAGDIVPLSRDRTTGNLRLAVPNIFRGLTTEGPQLDSQGNLTVPGATINPNTGSLGITPEAALTGTLGQPPRLGFHVAPSPLPRILELLRNPDAPPPSGPPGPEMHAVEPPVSPPKWQPTPEETKALNDARWQAIRDNAGAAVMPDYAKDGLLDAIKKLQPQGPLSEAVAGSGPTGQLAVKLQGAVGQPITLGDFASADSDLGGQISQQYTSGNPNTARILRGVQADLRDHFENAGPDDVVGGQEGFDALDPARKTNSQLQKMSDIQDMIYKASLRGDAGGNEAGSMRTQLINYLASDQSRGLSDMERAAAQSAIKRGGLSVALDAAKHIASPMVGGFVGGVPGALGAEATRTGLGMWTGAIAKARVQGLLDTLGEGVPPPP
jgi:hypothetical protein